MPSFLNNKKTWGAGLLVLAVVQFSYVVWLISQLSDPNFLFDKSAAVHAELAGRMIAALGLGVGVARIVKKERLIVFVIAFATVFFGMKLAADVVINGLDKEIKSAGHALALYRISVLNRQVDDRELLQSPVALANIPMLAVVDGERIRGTVNSISRDLSQQSIATLETKQTEALWQKYSQISSLAKPLWLAYRVQHKNGTMPDFMLKIAAHERFGADFQRWAKTEILPGIGSAKPLFAGNLPLFLNRAQFDKDIAQHALRIAREAAPGDGVSSLSNVMSEAVFVPPISLTGVLAAGLLNVLGGILAVAAGECASKTTQRATVFLFLFAILVVALTYKPFPTSARLTQAHNNIAGMGVVGGVWAASISLQSIVVDAARLVITETKK